MNILSGATTARGLWTPVLAVGLATFSVVTTEMLPVGLLTAIAGTLSVTTGNAGLMISLPALLAALFAPFVVIASGGIDRRVILCGLLVLLVMANLTSALAPNLTIMLIARALVGFCMGGIWAIAGGLAARLVPESAVGLATSIIFGGVAAASVLGVPLGAFIGDAIGWRWAFGCMALFSTLVLVLHLAVIPTLPVAVCANIGQFFAQLANRKLLAGLLLTLLLVTSHFAAFTFVRPLLISVSGFNTQWIGAILFAYGIAGIMGNFLVGIYAAHHTRLTLMAVATGLVVTPVLFLSKGQNIMGGGAILIFWGLAYGGLSVGLMTWMMKAAPRAVEIAAALYVGIFNTGIATGAWAGGKLVDALTLTAPLWLASGLAIVALLLTVMAGFTSTRTG
ncbi:MFS transporter [Phytobacter diazotrophicus]|uniref:MFS transporter n=1 Tax=Phytobacter diazotrophicus TaxID=395631 RepID=UPI0023312C60|nr:MFS transporter [Phytobacter diazotrophicus]MDC0728606.1 MFS transporter [Phytobacter diazotrophicus]MDC0735857.1 MFS transporter [Phytobacter diazotrophicus]